MEDTCPHCGYKHSIKELDRDAGPFCVECGTDMSIRSSSMNQEGEKIPTGSIKKARQLLGEACGDLIVTSVMEYCDILEAMDKASQKITDTMTMLDNMKKVEALDIIMDVHGVYWLRGRDAEFCINLEYDGRDPIVKKHLRREAGVEEPPTEDFVRDCGTCKIWLPHGFGPVDQDQIRKDACYDCSIEGREGWTPEEPDEEPGKKEEK